MVNEIKCPGCGNKDINQIRYIEEQLIDAEYQLFVREGHIVADLSHCLNRDWDGEVTRRNLRCSQCMEMFEDPGIQTFS